MTNGDSFNVNDDIPSALSSSALQNKLRQLREESQRVSQLLTQKLASSQSGQNLLHIGTSLSTLPPDLHSLLTHLHPVLSAAELSEKEQLQNLQELVQAAQEIRLCERRVQHAAQCADLYADLVAAERSLQPKNADIGIMEEENEHQGDEYEGEDLGDDDPALGTYTRNVHCLVLCVCAPAHLTLSCSRAGSSCLVGTIGSYRIMFDSRATVGDRYGIHPNDAHGYIYGSYNLVFAHDAHSTRPRCRKSPVLAQVGSQDSTFGIRHDKTVGK
jgi:hypothetical protein